LLFKQSRVALILAALAVEPLAVLAQSDSVQLNNLPAHSTRILAKFKDPSHVTTHGEALNQLNSKVHRSFKLMPGLVVLEESDAFALANPASTDHATRLNRLMSRMSALKNSGLFEYVEPDYEVHTTLAPTDQRFVDGTLWGLRNYGQSGGVAGADISATNAWDLTTGSTNVIVGVIDTGIRYTHHDLTNQMWHNPHPGSYQGFSNDVYGINAITGSGNPFDDNNHGTHVSGTIGAAANDGNPSVGVTWHVQLMGCKFLSAAGSGFTSDAITCVDYAVFNKARILNNSWGGGGYSQGLFDAINAALQQGVLFVAAAGNAANNNDLIPFYPCNYQLDNVVSVAAIDRTDSLAVFSDYGQNTVHLGAPGVDIFSSTAGSDTEYQIFSGTSMATPHVVGVAALILSRFPTADLTELKDRLLLGVVKTPALTGRTITGGRVNAYNSLTLTGHGTLNLAVDPPSTAVLLQGSTQPIFVKVTDVFPVRGATVTGVVDGVTNLTFLDNGVPPDAIASNGTYSVNFKVPSNTNTVVMTVTATAPGEVGVTNVIVYNLLPPPPNDYFTNATKVPAGGALYFANNRFGTREPGEPHHDGNPNDAASLWWVWSPASDTNVLIDTTGSLVDTLLAVYTGNTLGSLTQVVATNSNVAQHQHAFVSFSAQAGQAYRIAVASNGTNQLGSIEFRVAPGGNPDTTQPEVFVSSPVGGATLTNQSITVTGTAFDPPPDATGVSQVQVSVNGAIADTASGTTNWSSQAFLTPGQNTVVVTVSDAAGNTSSQTLQYFCLIQNPVNDFFAAATALTGTSGQVTVSNTNATKEVGEPNHAGNAGGKSVWWTFQPPADGVLTLSTTNSTFDTLLGLYTGTVVSNLTTIAANDDAYPAAPGGFSDIVQAVHSNVIYHIAVDGFDGVSGTVVLHYSFAPMPIYQVTAAAETGGTAQLSISNGVGGIQVQPTTTADFGYNSTAIMTATPNQGYLFDAWSGPVFSLSNTVQVVVQSNLTEFAGFKAIPLSDGFESGNFSTLAWTTSGNKPWTVQTSVVASGTYAARSGAITNSQSSSLMLTGNFRAGTGSFDYKVSSELGFDFLSFYIDNVLQQQWSGEVGWATYIFPLAAGTHTLKWTYAKDPSGSAGLDAAFLDNVFLPLVLPTNSMSAAHLDLERQSDGTLFITLVGQTNQVYVLQASSNFMNWQSFSTNAAIDGYVRVIDPGTATNPIRFYRAFVP
jgi:subtilisin family serine protease